MKKVALIFPYAPVYRQAVYKELDNYFDCGFFFCYNPGVNLQLLDCSLLRRVSLLMRYHRIFGGVHFFTRIPIRSICKYDNIILPGNPHNLSVWLLLLLFRFIKKKKTFIWTHGVYGRETPLQYRIKKLFFSLPDVILLYGEYAAKLIKTNNLAPANKLAILYNSLDLDKQVSYRTRKEPSPFFEHFSNNLKNIVFIGRLTEEKRLELLLYAVAATSTNNPLANITFIGTGEQEISLRQLGQELGIADYLWFYGKCFEEKEISMLLNHADLCVSPGNVGLTAIHCMSYGVPIITHSDFTHQGPEFEAITPGQTGSFFEANNVKSLSRAIIEWFNQHPDTEQVRKHCYEVVDTRYNPHYQVSILNELFI